MASERVGILKGAPLNPNLNRRTRRRATHLARVPRARARASRANTRARALHDSLVRHPLLRIVIRSLDRRAQARAEGGR